MSELLETVEHQTGEAPSASVIWLHGLGADGHDFVPIVAELALSEPLRFVFPHAPVRPVTLNGGLRMRAWYDIVALDRRGRQDLAGIRASRRQVEALIARERDRGIAPRRLVLAGFSQGGAIALYTGLRHPERLAGLVGLSCWLPDEGSLAEEAHAANRGLPMFLGHGSFDPMVPLAYGEASRDRLAADGYRIEWHSYPMAHSVCAEEIADVGAWLERVLEPDRDS